MKIPKKSSIGRPSGATSGRSNPMKCLNSRILINDDTVSSIDDIVELLDSYGIDSDIDDGGRLMVATVDMEEATIILASLLIDYEVI